jgi:hypothetical protein
LARRVQGRALDCWLHDSFNSIRIHYFEEDNQQLSYTNWLFDNCERHTFLLNYTEKWECIV